MCSCSLCGFAHIELTFLRQPSSAMATHHSPEQQRPVSSPAAASAGPTALDPTPDSERVRRFLLEEQEDAAPPDVKEAIAVQPDRFLSCVLVSCPYHIGDVLILLGLDASLRNQVCSDGISAPGRKMCRERCGRGCFAFADPRCHVFAVCP